jgi:hypothetical protein
MKNVKDIYNALVKGKKLVNREGTVIDLKTSVAVDFSMPENWEIYDPNYNLKRAYSEGAIIECKYKGEWVELLSTPLWEDIHEYRIKGGISIEQWDKWKDIIKAWWEGAEVENWCVISKDWEKETNPTWILIKSYRIAPKTNEDKIKNLDNLCIELNTDKWQIDSYGSIVRTIHEFSPTPYNFGLMYQTLKQAEKASKEMIKTNRLRSRVAQIQEDLDEGRFYIVQLPTGKYTYTNMAYPSIGTVTMTKRTATIICDELNRNKLVLDI